MSDKLLEGAKNDSGKPRYDLLSSVALDQLARVLTNGAVEYEDHNWRKGISMSRLIASSYRHLTAINGGEDVDPQFGLLHAAHLMCCAMFIAEQTLQRPEFDDRWKPQSKEEAFVDWKEHLNKMSIRTPE